MLQILGLLTGRFEHDIPTNLQHDFSKMRLFRTQNSLMLLVLLMLKLKKLLTTIWWRF